MAPGVEARRGGEVVPGGVRSLAANEIRPGRARAVVYFPVDRPCDEGSLTWPTRRVAIAPHSSLVGLDTRASEATVGDTRRAIPVRRPGQCLRRLFGIRCDPFAGATVAKSLPALDSDQAALRLGVQAAQGGWEA